MVFFPFGDYSHSWEYHFDDSFLGLINENKKNMKTLYKNIVIPATSGKRTIAKASDVFKGWIDSDFKNWKLDSKDIATKEANLAVLEIEKNVTFKDIFGEDFKSKALTQEQIIRFCENHSDKLRDGGYGTFFLFKVGEEFFIARVGFGSDDLLRVGAHRFSYGYVWGAECRLRIVVPQLALESFDSSPSDTLTLAIEQVKKAGYKIFKEI